MNHPPYSRDLALSDFWLFDYIKQCLDNHSSAKSLEKPIVETLEVMPHQEYINTFEKWLERMKLCEKCEGENFKHLINKI